MAKANGSKLKRATSFSKNSKIITAQKPIHSHLVKGNITLLSCFLLLTLSFAICSYLQSGKRITKQMNGFKRVSLCMIRYREMLIKHIKQMEKINAAIQLSYAASTVPTTRTAALITIEALKKTQLLLQAKATKEIIANNQCSAIQRGKLIANLPYLQYGSIKRGIDQTALPKVKEWKIRIADANQRIGWESQFKLVSYPQQGISITESLL